MTRSIQQSWKVVESWHLSSRVPHNAHLANGLSAQQQPLRERGPPVRCRPGREQMSRFIEAAAALRSRGCGKCQELRGVHEVRGLVLPRRSGQTRTRRDRSDRQVARFPAPQAQSVRSQQPFSSTSLVTTSSTSHRP